MIRQLNPYVHFNGTAAEAIRLYESALGATLAFSMRYGEAECAQAAPEHKDLIMHATLNVGAGVLMLSDTTPDCRVPEGGNMQVMLEYTDIAEMTRAFDALAAGGSVVMALQDTFWGARFGMLLDRFGVRWMFQSPREGK